MKHTIKSLNRQNILNPDNDGIIDFPEFGTKSDSNTEFEFDDNIPNKITFIFTDAARNKCRQNIELSKYGLTYDYVLDKIRQVFDSNKGYTSPLAKFQRGTTKKVLINVFGKELTIFPHNCVATLIKDSEEKVTIKSLAQSGEYSLIPVYTVKECEKTADEFIEEFGRLNYIEHKASKITN